MRRSKRGGDREHGQIIVLFAMVLVVILAFGAIVVDLGVLRNNRQTLVNALDAAALAGGTKLPVKGATEAAAANALIVQTIQANYPGLPSSSYSISYKCLIGANATGPLVSRDVPRTCDPRPSLGLGTALPPSSAFTGAGPTRVSACDPTRGDMCNAVLVTGSANTPFSLGPVVGVPSGSTGIVTSASCRGPCGAPPVIPVDVVMILDRTLSMQEAGEIAALQSGANTVLSVFDPALQRVALGTIGPSRVTYAGAPIMAACPYQSTSPLRSLSSPANQVFGVGQSPATNVNFFAVPADLGKWIPVGFSGTDTATPAITSGWGFREAYSANGTTNTNSTIWKAISCFYAYSQGTNLETPIMMAQRYLATYGRPGVKKGIILETDGTPQAGDGSAHYTCNAANNAATAAKAAGIEIFTIGFGISGQTCPTRSGYSGNVNPYESAAWSGDPTSSLLASMATDANHYFDAPDSTTLVDAFTQAAVALATGKARLVQLYPTPVVTGVSPATGTPAGGNSVTINGKFFTGAIAVQFGGAGAAHTVTSDTSITATAPAGTAGLTVDITVTTPGGTTTIGPADRYTYTSP